MKSLRMLGALLVAVFAFAVVGVSAASASEPEFRPGNKLIDFIFTSATSVLATTGNVVTCKSDVGSGSITGTDTVANVHVSFSGCTVAVTAGTCVIESVKPLGTPGLIDTVTLKGELGTVKTAEAASLVGLLLEPQGGEAEYTTLKETACSVETKVTGKLAGEVLPVRSSQRLGTVKFATSGGKQAIKEINELGKGFVEIPTLKAFGLAATETTTENILFAEAVEVT